MKTKNIFTQKEKGQVIVLLAIITLTVLAFITLIFDGGMLMINKRHAQAAADAGALAGARILCKTHSENEAITTAVHYARDLNKATDAAANIEATPLGNRNIVAVTASMKNVSILFDTSISANAKARCVIPYNYIIPISFYCLNPVSNNDCGVDMFDLGGKKWDGTTQPTSTLYVFPDHIELKGTSDDSYTRCDEKMNCNLDRNNDGIVDTKVFDRRDYTPDLCTGAVVPCLNAIFNHLIPPPTINLTLTGGWVDIQANADLTGFNNTIQGNLPYLFLVPFYDQCDPADCYDARRVHIAGTSSFIVWCSSNHVIQTDGCPGKTIWLNKNPYVKGARTIEGYFVKNSPVDLTNPGSIDAPNVGTYYISLIK